MSIETSIATLMASLNSALALPQQIADLASEKVAEIGNAYQSRISGMSVYMYLDAINGLDTNDGTQAHPKKTLDAAIAAAPRGAMVTINLLTDVEWSTQVALGGRRVLITSSGSKKSLKPIAGTYNQSNVNWRRMGSFSFLDGGGVLILLSVNLIIPPIPNGADAYTVGGEGIFLSSWASNLVVFGTYDVDINFPANPCGPSITATPAVINWNAVTLSGQSYLGKIIKDVTTTAGTATTSIPYLLTNLTQV